MYCGLKNSWIRTSGLAGLLLSLLVGLTGTALADTIHFSDHTPPLRCVVTAVTPEFVKVQTPDGQAHALSRRRVVRIEMDPVHAKDPTPPAGPVLKPLPMRPMGEASLENDSSGKSTAVNALMYSPLLPGLSFTNEKGEVNDKHFVTLSRFKGQSTRQVYAGLYNFQNKGTFWIRLPQTQSRPADLQFVLYGKQNVSQAQAQPPEPYDLQARFLDEQGNAIASSPMASFQEGQITEVEWFHLLEGMSGLCGKKEVTWRVPEGTKTIEFRVMSAEDAPRRLVGYLGNVTLIGVAP
jgi:hypothetical protein